MRPPADRGDERIGDEREDGAGEPAVTPTRWERLEEIFSRAVDLPPEEREDFLAEACREDAALRGEVDSLLSEHDREPGPLDATPPWLGEAGPEIDEDTPGSIGPYRIVRLLGRGGMGRVFLAEREAPGFRQLVAVKVMRRGLDTADLLARFRTERQILARLNHPNIARLFDVGATERGLPYFVMEYVDGVPILEHCDREGLTVTHRLRLFRTVCDAVHHAHQGLIVHRDLKPQNILVTGEGVPKLLDFGIAKILDPTHELGIALTRGELRVLTPEYCAPEQLRGEPVTTACDVYALGILLYELLAGRHPYAAAAIERRTPKELALQVDPAPPSVAVAAPGRPAEEVAAARRVSSAQLRRRLEVDLDTVVLEALRKEPEERYGSALSLAEDVERHLAGLPVHARPATAGYRLRKFVARHRVPVAAAALVVLLLSGFTGLTLHQSGRIRAESERVARERDKALQVRSFLLEMFGATGPDQPTGDTVTARQLLDRRAATLEEAYADDPEMRAEMMTVLAEGYEKLGLIERAEPLGREALEIRRAVLGPSHGDVAASLNLLGWIVREGGRLEEAEMLLREAVETGRRAFPPEGDPRLARALNDLGAVLDTRGAYDEAAELYRESLDMRLRLLGEEHVGVAVTTSNLAVALYHTGDLEGAARAGEEALERFRRVLGPDHQRTMMVETNLASMHTARGDHEAAARLHRQILERRERLFGTRHASVATSLMMLANALAPMGELEEAERLVTEALAIQREGSGVRRDELAWTWRVLGDIKARAGRPAEALPDYAEALAILRATVGETHEEVGRIMALRAAAYEALGEPEAAARDFAEAIRIYDETLGAEHARTLDARLSFARHLRAEDRDRAAEALLDEVDRAMNAAGFAADHPLRQRADAVRRSGSS